MFYLYDMKGQPVVSAFLKSMDVRHKGVLLMCLDPNGRTTALSEMFDSLVACLPDVLGDSRFPLLMTMLKSVGQMMPSHSLAKFLRQLNTCFVEGSDASHLSEISACLVSKADMMEEVISAEPGLTVSTSAFRRSFSSLHPIQPFVDLWQCYFKICSQSLCDKAFDEHAMLLSRELDQASPSPNLVEHTCLLLDLVDNKTR